MRDSSTLSPWQSIEFNASDSSTRSEFDVNKVYDCLIIGAGITGISSALQLQLMGAVRYVDGDKPAETEPVQEDQHASRNRRAPTLLNPKETKEIFG